MVMVERVLESKGVPLFRRYYDGSAVVELLKQLDSSPDLAIEVFNWRREQMDCGVPMTKEEYAKGINVAGKLKDIDLAKEDLLEAMEDSISKAFENNIVVRTNAIMLCIASSYFRRDAVDKLDDFLKHAEFAGWKICRSLYHCRMVMYSAQRRLADMERVIDEMEQVNLYISKKTFWILYKAYERWGEKSKLEAVVGMMCKHGYEIPLGTPSS